MLFIKLNFIKIKSLKLLVLKIVSRFLLLILIETEQFNRYFLMITGQKQNLAMMPYKSLGNIDKKFLSRLAGFGR